MVAPCVLHVLHFRPGRPGGIVAPHWPHLSRGGCDRMVPIDRKSPMDNRLASSTAVLGVIAVTILSLFVVRDFQHRGWAVLQPYQFVNHMHQPIADNLSANNHLPHSAANTGDAPTEVYAVLPYGTLKTRLVHQHHDSWQRLACRALWLCHHSPFRVGCSHSPLTGCFPLLCCLCVAGCSTNNRARLRLLLYWLRHRPSVLSKVVIRQFRKTALGNCNLLFPLVAAPLSSKYAG